MKPAGSALERCLSALPPESLVLVAVSGGADSVYLLELLAERLPEDGHRLAAVHVNHGQRGGDSDADALFTEELCRSLGVDVYMERPALPAGAGEDMLREARLAAVKRVAKALGATAAAFGHTRDDAAETFLLMALRGSGPHGLGSMVEMRRLSGGLLFLRPMLDMDRAEVRAELTARRRTWREDASNKDVRYRRNALRREVLPVLSRVDGNAAVSLARSASLCGALSRELSALAGTIVHTSLRCCREEVALFRLPDMREFPIEAATEVLRAMLRVYTAGALEGAKPLLPGRTLLQDIAAHLVHPPPEPAAFRLPQGMCLWLGKETLLFPEHLSLEGALLRCRDCLTFLAYQGTEIPVSAGGECSLEGETIRVEQLPGPPGGLLGHLVAGGERVAWLDEEALGGPLVFRRARRPDWVELADGLSKPVLKLLQERGVPAPLRRTAVAVLAEGDRLLWIPGLWRSPHARLTPDSRRLLRVEWLGAGCG